MVWLVTNSMEGLSMISVFYTVFYTIIESGKIMLTHLCRVSLAIPAMEAKWTTGLSGSGPLRYSPVSAILNITSSCQQFLSCLKHDVYFHQPSKSMAPRKGAKVVGNKIAMSINHCIPTEAVESSLRPVSR